MEPSAFDQYVQAKKMVGISGHPFIKHLTFYDVTGFKAGDTSLN